VRETGRSPFVLEERSTAGEEPSFEDVVLEEAGTVTFGGVDPPRCVDGLFAWDVDDAGRVGMIRRDPAGLRFLRIDARGQASADVPLASLGDVFSGAVLWWAGDRWLVVASADWNRSTAIWLDAKSGASSPLASWEGERFLGLRRLPYGGFVAYRSASIGRFDADGRRLWRFDAGPRTPLLGIDDVSVTPVGSVLVLDRRGRRIGVFDAAGRVADSIDLEVALPDCRGPRQVRAELSGTVLVVDGTAIWRLREGPLARFVLRDARRRWQPSVDRIAPDGSWWFVDESSFLRVEPPDLSPDTTLVETSVLPSRFGIAGLVKQMKEPNWIYSGKIRRYVLKQI
jgi:hypothetical protein